MNTDELYLTAAGRDKLRAELAELKDEQRPALARRLREAIQMGDLSENADYIAAKEEQAFLEGRILEIEEILKQAVIIAEGAPTDTVSIGNTVTIIEDGREPEVYSLVGVREADPRAGKISNESPIGAALLGKRVGDAVTVQAPGGEMQFSILKIE